MHLVFPTEPWVNVQNLLEGFGSPLESVEVKVDHAQPVKKGGVLPVVRLQTKVPGGVH